jgi:hypothetical protein
MYSIGARRKWMTRAGEFGLVGRITFRPSDPDPDGRRFFFFTGVHLSSKAGGRPFELRTLLAPVCFVDIAHGGTSKKPVDVDLRDGVLAIRGDGGLFRFKAETGELVELVYENHGRVRIYPRRGAVDEALARIDAAGAANSLDAAHPLASAAAFVAEAAIANPMLSPRATPTQRATAASAARKLLTSKGVLDVGDPWSRLEPVERFEGFFIPVDVAGVVAASEGNALAFLGEAVPYCDFFFVRESWPWTVAREALLVSAGRAKYTDTEARRFFQSPDVGPIGFLVAANLYARVNDATTARVFAKRGLERLTFEAFSRDCRTLLANGSVQAAALSGVLGAARGLSDEEVGAMSAVLPAAYGNAIKALSAFGRVAVADGQVLPESLQRTLWEGGMKELVEGMLNDVANAR